MGGPAVLLVITTGFIWSFILPLGSSRRRFRMTFNVFSKLTGGAVLGLLYAFAAFWSSRDGRF